MYTFTAEKDGKVVKTLGDFVSLNEVVQELARLEFEVHEWEDDWKAIATSSQTDFRYDFCMGAWWCENEHEEEDPTPWCHQCGAMEPNDCDCLPIASNN